MTVWTDSARAQFLEALAQCGCVRDAVAAIGVTRQSAYALRARDSEFARAWDTARLAARDVLVEELTCRALDGWQEEVWFRGEQVGTRQRHDNRLLLSLLGRIDAGYGQYLFAPGPDPVRGVGRLANIVESVATGQPTDSHYRLSDGEQSTQQRREKDRQMTEMMKAAFRGV